MGGTFEIRALDGLTPDPANRDLFDAADGMALAELTRSIADHGLINPITIRPDGTIIAGEDRYRAALAAGLEQVWVSVRDVDDAGAEVLRIEENVRRKDLKPTERARAIRRLYERHGVQGRGGDHRSKLPDVTLKPLAEEVGLSQKQVKVYNTLADLIPPLGALLDAGTISQAVAYQLAQLPSEQQGSIAATFSAAELRQEQTVKEMKRALDALDREVKRLSKELDGSDAERVRREKQGEMDRLRRQKDEEIQRAKEYAAAKIAQLEKERAVVDGWQRKDPINKTLLALNDMAMLDVERAATRVLGHKGLGAFIALHLDIVDLCIPWLQQYAAHLRRAHGLPEGSEAVPTDIRRARVEKMRHDVNAALAAEMETDGNGE